MILSRKLLPKFKYLSRFVPKRCCSTDPDRPIKYIGSGASKWRAEVSRSGIRGEPRLWYEPEVIMVSVATFLIYFCILREENDVDEELQRSLYSRIEGLEEHQLRQSLEYNRLHGLDTTDIVNRLKELEEMKK